MPAKSKAQQKFMGMVHACQKGGKCASKEVASAAKSMTKKAAKDFASTKTKGLPEKKKKLKENTMNIQKKLAVGFINDICTKDFSGAKQKLASMVDEKIKTRIKTIANSLESVEEKAAKPTENEKKEVVAGKQEEKKQ